MAVFRVKHRHHFTTMSNYHLRDSHLTLRAKGLLSMMLSLPDGWNYSTRGLAAICREGVDAVGRAVRELEEAGYLIRRRHRGAGGRILDIEYVIYEEPRQHAVPETDGAKAGAAGTDANGADKSVEATPGTAAPHTGFPYTAEPYTVSPHMEGPDTEKPPEFNTEQSNTEESNTEESNTEESNTEESNTEESILHRGGKHSFFPSAAPRNRAALPLERRTEGQAEIVRLREEIKAQIEYDLIADTFNREQINEFVEIMLEVALARSPTIRIGRDREYPTALVRDRFAQIDASHIQRILEAIEDNTTHVRNTKAYLLAALFNVTSTIGNHYTLLVNHDMHTQGPNRA